MISNEIEILEVHGLGRSAIVFALNRTVSRARKEPLPTHGIICFQSIPHFVEESYKILLRNGDTIYADPLADGDKVRRGEKSY